MVTVTKMTGKVPKKIIKKYIIINDNNNFTLSLFVTLTHGNSKKKVPKVPKCKNI